MASGVQRPKITTPTFRPALIIEPDTPKKGDAIESSKRVSPIGTPHAPTNIGIVGNNKLRIKFDSDEYRQDSLKRFKGHDVLKADCAKL